MYCLVENRTNHTLNTVVPYKLEQKRLKYVTI